MKRALISCYDKTGIVEFAQKLSSLGWEIISTGGTYKELKNSGLNAIEIEEITNFSEILDGRVKTLHPHIHGGILYQRENSSHIDTIREKNIEPIDMVVNNLYPFGETIKKAGVTQEEIIENIDIGGPSMIRAAAKNYQYVSVIVDPKDYEKVLTELESRGDTKIETRRYLARKVFNYTAYYDALISNHLNQLEEVIFPDYMTYPCKLQQELRYGENPHQQAAFYKESMDIKGSVAHGNQFHGKELSFNNINDGNAAIDMVQEFDEPTIVAVKHANACGIGSGETLLEAYQKAYECDTQSIYGGIIAANRELDEDVAIEISKIFIEVLIAPSFTEAAIEILTQKKNIRLIQIGKLDNKNEKQIDFKKVSGGLLIQQKDFLLLDGELRAVTDRKPTEKEMEDLLFAWKAAKNIKSNGVVLAKNKGTLGLGLGEVNRSWAVENAVKRAGKKAKGSVLASDGFFPFRDSVEILTKAGVTAIIQPGGSIRDGEVIEEANQNNISMIFTGVRHFKH